MANSDYEACLQAALAELKLQDTPNYLATARKHSVKRTTLRARFLEIHTSRSVAYSEYHQRLTTTQEEVLIRHINRLTYRGIPPTSQMVRNFAEEMIHDCVGHSWTSDFVRRHRDRLTSQYLHNIDKKRVNAESIPLFKQFYNLVS